MYRLTNSKGATCTLRGVQIKRDISLTKHSNTDFQQFKRTHDVPPEIIAKTSSRKAADPLLLTMAPWPCHDRHHIPSSALQDNVQQNHAHEHTTDNYKENLPSIKYY